MATGLLQMLAATLALKYALSRSTPRYLVALFGQEGARFIGALVSLVCVWIFMGFLAFIPAVGDILGWKWVPQFVSRVTAGNLSESLAGLLFNLFSLAFITLSLFTWTSRLRVTDGSRWSLFTASFYLSTLWIDGVRICFTVDGATRVGSLISPAAMYLGIIAVGSLIDGQIHKRRLDVRGFVVSQVIGLLVASSLVGRMFEVGSVHLSAVPYASVFQELTSTFGRGAHVCPCVRLQHLVVKEIRFRFPRGGLMSIRRRAKRPALLYWAAGKLLSQGRIGSADRSPGSAPTSWAGAWAWSSPPHNQVARSLT